MDKLKDFHGNVGKRSATPGGSPKPAAKPSPEESLKKEKTGAIGKEKTEKDKKSQPKGKPYKSSAPQQKEKDEKKKTFTRATSEPNAEMGRAPEKVQYERVKSEAPTTDRTFWGRKVNQVWARLDFDQCEPEFCVGLLRVPAMKTYSALNKKLKANAQDWIQGFLEAGGLEVLLESVDSVGNKRVQLADAMMLLECVACIKSLMNSKMGLEYMIENRDYTRKLVKALDTSNVMVKKQIFEILSALCVYSEEGSKQTLAALEWYKTTKNQRYRFSVLINEMRNTDVASYLATTMGLVNCLILTNENLDDRVRMRNEFIALNLLDHINTLRDVDDDDVQIQCDVFYDEKQEDEDAWAVEKPQGVDLNSHADVFNTLFQKVCNTPNASPFLSVLQSLLRIDNENKTSDLKWGLAERSVQKAVIAENTRDGERLLEGSMALDSPDGPATKTQSVSTQTEDSWRAASTKNGHARVAGRRSKLVSQDSNDVDEFETPPSSPSLGKRNSPAVTKSTLPTTPASSTPSPPPLLVGNIDLPPPPPPPSATTGDAPPPPLPPPITGGAMPPAPPPPMTGGAPVPPPPPPAPMIGGGPPPPPPSPMVGGAPPPPPAIMGGPPPPPPGLGGVPAGPPPFPGSLSTASAPTTPAALNTIPTPKPKSKMKTLNWTKVNQMTASNSDTIWKDILKMEDPVKVDYVDIEELFSQKKRDTTVPQDQEKKKGPTEICLLDMKRSMNINIFLKQFRMDNTAIIEQIEQGDEKKIGIEKMKGLINILPQQDEIGMIMDFDGDKQKLGNAEKFFHLLIELPAYKIRIDGMLLKLEFGTSYETIVPNIKAITDSCRGILDSKSLRSFLRFILHTGNFINSGGYAGNAMGFKLSSLNKLTDTRSNKPRVTLLHYLVEKASHGDIKNTTVLGFADDLITPLTIASRLSVDGLSSEVRQLETSVKKLTNQMQNASEDIKMQFTTFAWKANKDLEHLNECITKTQTLSKQLAEHFCEDSNTFKVEECLITFKTFCEKVKQCQQENELRRIQEEKAEKRRQENQVISAQKKEDKEQPPEPADGFIIDRLLKGIKRGESLRRTGVPGKTGQPAASKSKTPSILEGRERTGVQVFPTPESVSQC